MATFDLIIRVVGDDPLLVGERLRFSRIQEREVVSVRTVSGGEFAPPDLHYGQRVLNDPEWRIVRVVGATRAQIDRFLESDTPSSETTLEAGGTQEVMPRKRRIGGATGTAVLQPRQAIQDRGNDFGYDFKISVALVSEEDKPAIARDASGYVIFGT